MLKLKPHKAADAVLERLRFPAVVSPKIDGVRGCYLTSKFTSRTLKPFRNKTLVERLSDPALQGLDGELAKGDPLSEGLCRRTTSYVNSHAKNAESGFPDWYIFDYVTEVTQNLPYSTRMALAEDLIRKVQKEKPEKDYSFLKPMPLLRVCLSVEDVEQAHLAYLTKGFEGTVVRYAEAPHKSGRSTIAQSWFMRIKEAHTEEATILRLVEAQTNRNAPVLNNLGQIERSSHKGNKWGLGMIGALVVQIPDGRIITIGAGCLTHEERAAGWEQPDGIIGRICTYKFMVYGEHNLRRHPRFVEFRDEDL